MSEATEQYAIEFNQAEIDKLKRIAELLKVSAGQNAEYNQLSDWLSGIVNDDDGGEENPDKPKRKKKK